MKCTRLLILVTVLTLLVACLLPLTVSADTDVEEDEIAETVEAVDGAYEPVADADAENTADTTSAKAWAAAVAIAVVAGLGAVAMGFSIARASDGISRQPEAAGNIRTTLMLGLVFIETAIIYALIVAILVVFVL